MAKKPTQTIYLNPSAAAVAKDKLNGTVYDHVDKYYPWVRDGWKIIGGTHWPQSGKKHYKELWQLKRFGKTNLGSMVADFYLLDGVASCVILPEASTPQAAINPQALVDMAEAGFYFKDSDSLDAIALEAALLFSRKILAHAPLVRDYLHYAIASEIQFHQVGHPIGSGWTEIASAWYYMVKRFGHEKCAEWAEDCFDRPGWSSSYGGKPWANIARVARCYEQNNFEGQPFGAREFLDRAFSLQHNTGTVFNKTEWAGGDNLKWLLDAHANSVWYKLYDSASDDAKAIVDRYFAKAGVDLGLGLGRPVAKKKADPSNVSATPTHGSGMSYSPDAESNGDVTIDGAVYCTIDGCTMCSKIAVPHPSKDGWWCTLAKHLELVGTTTDKPYKPYKELSVGDTLIGGANHALYKIVDVSGDFYSAEPICVSATQGWKFEKKLIHRWIETSTYWNIISQADTLAPCKPNPFQVGTVFAMAGGGNMSWEVVELDENQRVTKYVTIWGDGSYSSSPTDTLASWTPEAVQNRLDSNFWVILSHPVSHVDPVFEKLLMEEEDIQNYKPLKAGDVLMHKQHMVVDGSFGFWPLTVQGWSEDGKLQYSPANDPHQVFTEKGWTAAKAVKWLNNGTWILTQS